MRGKRPEHHAGDEMGGRLRPVGRKRLRVPLDVNELTIPADVDLDVVRPCWPTPARPRAPSADGWVDEGWSFGYLRAARALPVREGTITFRLSGARRQVADSLFGP